MGVESGEVVVLSSQSRLSALLEEVDSKTREAFVSVCGSNIATMLSSVRFIQEALLDKKALLALGSLCNYKAFPPDAVVFQEGDPATEFYIILKGQVQATQATTDRDSVEAGVRRVGDPFGVAALIYGSDERKYSIYASEHTLTLVVPRTSFDDFCGQSPRLEVRNRHVTVM